MPFFRARLATIGLIAIFAYLNLLYAQVASAAEAAPARSVPGENPEPQSAPIGSNDAGVAPDKTSGEDGTAEARALMTNSAAPLTGTASSGGTAPLGGQPIALPSGPGTVGGTGESFTADQSTGTGTYSMPIPLPPARGGMQPALALSYSSGAGSGAAGLGWSLGVAYVARQTDRGVPKYDDRADFHPEQDRFVFNGSDLIPLGAVHGGKVAAAPGEMMPPWAEGWQYFRARIENGYFRFFWSPDHRTWRIQSGHDGTSQELGVPLDGSNDTNALESASEGDAGRIFRWNLARTYDSNGQGKPTEDASPRPYNAVVYRYLHDGGVAYLSDIFDTSPAANAVAAPLSQYAHHTRLRWESRPDPSAGYRRGWRIDQRLRLTTVDISVKSFTAGVSGARRQLRRTHLEYDASTHVSLLTAVSLEGRCDGDEDSASLPQEDGNQQLPDATGCRRMPAMRFSYAHAQPANPVAAPPGYEPFDNTLQEMASSPALALDGSQGLMLVDFDGDGLPDVLDGDSARNGGAHRLFINDGRGSFSAPVPVDIPTVVAPDGSSGGGFDVSLKNANLASLDFDSDGKLDLVLMPRFRRPLVFSPTVDGAGFHWTGRVPAWAGQSGLELARLRDTTRVADVNGDGLIDFLVSAGSELFTYFSLAGFPGGEGAYGTATRTGPTTANVSVDPAHACPPASDGLAMLSDPRVHIADVNGDGLADIVRVRRGNAEYWPGRGDGHFGTGDLRACQSPMVAPAIAMDNPPFPSVADQDLRLGDVNGDGLTDLMAIDGTAVVVWLNVDGAGWTAPVTIPKSPLVGTVKSTVQVSDLNGSGTADLVFGDAGHYRYVDLLGGRRPWLLTGIDSGLGKTTAIEYTTSPAEAGRAAAAGTPWQSKLPTITQLLKRITVRDNLDKIGRKPGVFASEYSYFDPYFDRNDRAFRGFRTVARHEIAAGGDVGHSARVHFLLGECTDEDTPGRCTARDQDNPREGLKGLVQSSELFDDNGNYLSTTHTTYRLRRLYVGLDGREVRSVHASAADSYAYDTAPFVGQSDAVSLVDVERELAPGQIATESSSLVLRSVIGRVRVHSENIIDALGQAVEQRASGCVEGCAATDEVITHHTTFGPIPEDASGWFYRPTESWITGSQTTAPRHHAVIDYDHFGRVAHMGSVLQGTLPLWRAHESGKAIAPTPAGASTDGIVVEAAPTYDPFGHVTAVRGAAHRCSSTAFDSDYAELPVAQTSSAGPLAGDGCGATKLTTSAAYDRGFALARSVTGPNSETGEAEFDDFGRPTRVFAPHPDVLGLVSPQPSTTYEYWIPSEGRPLLGVHTRHLRGATPQDATYADSWAFADSLGRGLAAFSSADPSRGDAGQWLVTGFPDYDSVGNLLSAHLPVFWDGDPLQYDWSTTPTSAAERRVYDAFGRTVQRFATDGTLAAKVDYHALSRDLWDAADLSGGPHAGTFTSVASDGHGRSLSTVERINQGSGLQLIETRTAYLPSGETASITHAVRGSSEAPVVRWMLYDTLGRLVLNAEPNTTIGFTQTPPSDLSGLRAWRYAYDDAGDLVGTSDARGCGANLFYDTAGRVVAEDRSPCLDSQAPYTPADPISGEGTEVFYRYDQADPDTAAGALEGCGPATGLLSAMAGRNASITAMGWKSIGVFDGRGRLVCVAKRLARPDAASAATLAGRFAPRWYTKQLAYDGADRVVMESTGARSPELVGTDGSSVMHISYSARGLPSSIEGSYGTLIQSIQYNELGKPLKTVYGDLAGTTTSLTYDARHRLAAAQTMRQPPPLWSTATGHYTPPPPGTPPTLQTVLEDAQIFYDEADNPIELRDQRDATQWPNGAKPVTRRVEYDDLYRVKHVQYVYAAGTDSWRSPFVAELAAGARGDHSRPLPSPHVAFDKRVQDETFDYDWRGNIVAAQDDAHGFYDRSIGTQQHGTAAAGPHQLLSANNRDLGAGRAGDLSAGYDATGNLTALVVRRDGPCLPDSASCWQRFAYDWDEIGQLARARRWDLSASERPALAVTSGPLPARTPEVELRYGYGVGGGRVRKTAVDVNGVQIHDLYVFGSLELRRAPFDATTGDYLLSADSESVRLGVSGSALGRVVFAEHDLPAQQSGRQHVFLELADHLGSTTIAIDRETSELVQRSAYTTYGGTDSDYRPDRWDSFREPYRFTGKEEDIEVGLTYFGKRYYSPALNRFISADPQEIHSPGTADANVYCYVHGRAFAAIDPDGRFPQLLIAAIVAVVAAIVTDVVQQEVHIQSEAERGHHVDFNWAELGINVGIAAVVSIAGGAVGGTVTGALAKPVGSAAASIIGSAVGSTVSALVGNGLQQGAAYLFGRGHWSWSEFAYSGLVGAASGGLGAAATAATGTSIIGSGVSALTKSVGHSIVSGTLGGASIPGHLTAAFGSLFTAAFPQIYHDIQGASADKTTISGAGAHVLVRDGTGDILGRIKVLEYGPKPGHDGLRIRLEYADDYSSYKDFDWIQSIRTNVPLAGAISPYNDPNPPDDAEPFYWTAAEKALNTTRSGIKFSDGPTRDGQINVNWEAELSLVGKDSAGKWEILQTLRYGFNIDAAGTVTRDPISITKPSSFQKASVP
jgi:RHS repeat-associated protein